MLACMYMLRVRLRPRRMSFYFFSTFASEGVDKGVRWEV